MPRSGAPSATVCNGTGGRPVDPPKPRRWPRHIASRRGRRRRGIQAHTRLRAEQRLADRRRRTTGRARYAWRRATAASGRRPRVGRRSRRRTWVTGDLDNPRPLVCNLWQARRQLLRHMLGDRGRPRMGTLAAAHLPQRLCNIAPGPGLSPACKLAACAVRHASPRGGDHRRGRRRCGGGRRLPRLCGDGGGGQRGAPDAVHAFAFAIAVWGRSSQRSEKCPPGAVGVPPTVEAAPLLAHAVRSPRQRRCKAGNRPATCANRPAAAGSPQTTHALRPRACRVTLRRWQSAHDGERMPAAWGRRPNARELVWCYAAEALA